MNPNRANRFERLRRFVKVTIVMEDQGLHRGHKHVEEKKKGIVVTRMDSLWHRLDDTNQAFRCQQLQVEGLMTRMQNRCWEVGLHLQLTAAGAAWRKIVEVPEVRMSQDPWRNPRRRIRARVTLSTPAGERQPE